MKQKKKEDEKERKRKEKKRIHVARRPRARLWENKNTSGFGMFEWWASGLDACVKRRHSHRPTWISECQRWRKRT